jgi:hypothetical protein
VGKLVLLVRKELGERKVRRERREKEEWLVTQVRRDYKENKE